MSMASGCMAQLREPAGFVRNRTGGHRKSPNLLSLLQDCIRRLDFQGGRQIHDHILRESLELRSSSGCLLIRLYAVFHCLADANYVFDKISEPDVRAWSAIIDANAKLGQSSQAIEFYCKAMELSVETDSHFLVAAVKACAEDSKWIREGKLLHHHAVELVADLDAYIISSLIDFYARSGALEDSHRVFRSLKNPDRVTWGIMIDAYTQHGHGQQALSLYRQMMERGMDVDKVIFLCAVKACCVVLDIEQLRNVHRYLVLYGVQDDNSLGNALVTAYAKCKQIKEARYVFTVLPKRNVITWGAIIEGYVQHGYFETAFHLCQALQKEKIDLDRVVILSYLKACSYSTSLYIGRLIHVYVLTNKLEMDLQLGCSVVDMYAKCGSLDDAFTSFQSLPCRNIVASNTMISAYLQHGCTKQAFSLIQETLEWNPILNELTIVCLLKLCSSMANLCLGRIVHTYIIDLGFDMDELIINTLIDLYTKCGTLNEARYVFDRSSKQDSVTWAVLIAGFVQHDRFQEGCKYFWQMLGQELEADEAVFLSGLKACTGAGDLSLGRLVHAQIITNNVECETSIGNSLVDFYGKCGSFSDTYAVFSNLKKRDQISYNAMIAVCAQYSQYQKSLHLLGAMIAGGMLPNQITLACTLSACTDLVAIDCGKLIHNLFIEMKVKDDLYIINALAGMYVKCGSPESALSVLNKSSHKDIVTWNTIIAGFAQHSLFKEAKSCFEQMCKSGVRPDGVTYLSLLSVCSHVGLVEEGRQLFKSMKRDHELIPTSDHYSCMIDLLGRTGCMSEATDFQDSTPYKASVEGQTSLLSHCKEKGFSELGSSCFNELVIVKDHDSVG